MTPRFRESKSEDLGAALQLLEHAGLPIADVSAERLCLIAESDRGICGVIGREVFRNIALLRSLVVSREARGSGIGAALVARLEALCSADGIEELWLLTIDAERFFASLGFTVRERTEAPPAIQGTEEFSSLCPGDAVLMSKNLSSSVPEDFLA